MSHKITIFLIIICGVIAAALGGYILSQLKLGSNTDPRFLARFNQGDASGESPKPQPDVPVPISNRQAISAITSLDENSLLFYELGTGRVINTNLGSLKEQVVSETVLPKFLKTIWSSNRKEVISIFNTESGPEYEYYNYNSQRTSALPKNIKSLVFSPDGSSIAYFQGGAEGGIYLAQPDGSAAKKILNTRLENIELFWQSQEMLSFLAKMGASDRYEFFTLSVNGQFQKILSSLSNLKINWFPDGAKFIYSTQDEKSLRLFYKNLTSKEQPLELKTAATKCVWSSDASRLFCGVPTSLGLPSPDDIYSYNLITHTTEELFMSGNPAIRIGEILLSPKEDLILFTNTYNNLIYQMPTTK